MTMYLEDFKEIVENLMIGKQDRSDYIDKINQTDRCLSDFIYDNQYVNSVAVENDFLIRKLFGEELTEDVFWFLYDWKPGYDITVNEVTYNINDLESYIDYVNNVYKLPMRPKIIKEET